MRILYGVVGEGMGHAIRSSVVLSYLLAQGHEVCVMASGRAVAFLEKRLATHPNARVKGIHGFFIVYEDHRVRRGRTALFNAVEGLASVPEQIRTYFEVISEFRPQFVISDFESWTYVYGKAHSLPILSIDNMQMINRCVLPEQAIAEHRIDFEIAKGFVKAKLPFANEYLVTSFAELPLRKERTHLVPPILRPEILDAARRQGEHLLVYQTAEGDHGLAHALEQTGIPCKVYGMRRDLKSDVVERNLTYRPFSESVFVDDLASARAVVASAGFTLMGEAVYLQKPMLAVPVAGQFEQVLNALVLEQCGYGKMASALNELALRAFVAEIPRFAERLSHYTQARNNVLEQYVSDFALRVEMNCV